MRSRKSRAKRATRFSGALAARRKERGYPSGYAFFHKNGGKKAFGFTYPFYAMLERGERLPSVESLRAILRALGLESPAFQAERRELLRLFVDGLAGDDPAFFGSVMVASDAGGASAPAAGAGADAVLAVEAANRKLASVPVMTVEQSAALGTNATAFWAFQVLLQSGRSLHATLVAGILEKPEPEVGFALESLRRLGLVTMQKDGAYRSRHFDTDLFAPPGTVTPEKIQWSSEEIGRRIQAAGKRTYYGNFFLAIDGERAMASLTAVFRDAVRRSYLLRPVEPVRRGDLVAIEARVTPMFRITE